MIISVTCFVIYSQRGFGYCAPFRMGRGGRAQTNRCVGVVDPRYQRNSGFYGNETAVISGGNGSTGYETSRGRAVSRGVRIPKIKRGVLISGAVLELFQLIKLINTGSKHNVSWKKNLGITRPLN